MPAHAVGGKGFFMAGPALHGINDNLSLVVHLDVRAVAVRTSHISGGMYAFGPVIHNAGRGVLVAFVTLVTTGIRKPGCRQYRGNKTRPCCGFHHMFLAFILFSACYIF
jgi:hypothetical protein